MILATWFYSSPSGENFSYPSVGDNSSDESFQLCYFKCVINFFASSYLINYDEIKCGSLRHIFLCNEIPSFLDSIMFKEMLAKLNVQVVHFKPTRIPTFSKVNKLLFGSVFTQLDAIQALCELVSDEDKICLLDNDVLINKSMSLILGELGHNPVVLRQQSGDPEQLIQGIPLKTLNSISDLVDADNYFFRPYIHTGGELVAMSGRSLKKFSALCNKSYESNLKLYLSNPSGPYFQTEEQIFSSVYRSFQNLNFSSFIDRIWTDEKKYRTVNGFENNLTFLHIPSEKRSGFSLLFDEFFKLISTGEPLNPDTLRRIYHFPNVKIRCNL